MIHQPSLYDDMSSPILVSTQLAGLCLVWMILLREVQESHKSSDLMYSSQAQVSGSWLERERERASCIGWVILVTSLLEGIG